MQDFENLISQALADGQSIDAIAKQVTEAFNAAMKQKRETENTTLREKYIKDIEQNFWKHMKDDTISLDDATALAWLAIVHKTEYGKSIQDPEILEDLFNYIDHILRHVEDSFKVTKGLKDTFEDIADVFDLDLDKLFQIKKPVNKSKDRVRGGTDRKSECTLSDRECIEKFLRDLG